MNLNGDCFQLKSFSTRESMMQQTLRDEEGTLAYVRATGSLFLKVSQGWKEIQVLTQINGQYLAKMCFACNFTKCDHR